MLILWPSNRIRRYVWKGHSVGMVRKSFGRFVASRENNFGRHCARRRRRFCEKLIVREKRFWLFKPPGNGHRTHTQTGYDGDYDVFFKKVGYNIIVLYRF